MLRTHVARDWPLSFLFLFFFSFSFRNVSLSKLVKSRRGKASLLTVNVQGYFADDRSGHLLRLGPALELRAPQRPRHLVDEQTVHREFAGRAD